MTDHSLLAVVVGYHAVPDLWEFLVSWDCFNDVGAKLVLVQVECNQAERQQGDKWLAMGACDRFKPYDTNVGYARACNEAVRDAGADTFLFLNADTRLREDVLRKCMDSLWSNPSHAAVGPLQVDEKGFITHAGIFLPSKPFHRGWRRLDVNNFQDFRDDCSTVSGSAYFIKAEVWRELTVCPVYQAVFPGAEGAFLPTPLFYEETGCSYHARAHGYKICYEGRAKMIHNWHSSARLYPDHVRSCMRESQAMFRKFCDRHNIEHD